jgi:hypothetical protein
LEEALGQGTGDATSILCTQPRRVAAISVAERVADELGDVAIGKGLVGYQIRMETRRGPDTRLLFCTTGVILRRLIEDPTLQGISHVVVDEVHERQVWTHVGCFVLVDRIFSRCCGPHSCLLTVANRHFAGCAPKFAPHFPSGFESDFGENV